MKKIITILGAVFMLTAGCLFPDFSFAQAPQAFKYQTIVRDNGGNILANHAVSFRISILQGTSTGASVFTETQTATTNQFGLANLSIGSGTLVSGSFSTISWGTNNYFVEIEFDAAGGTNFTMMGTSQLLSVPYALYAQNSSGWSLTGNTGTVDGTNFIGTIDYKPFNIRVRNEKAGRIDFDPNLASTFFGYQAGNANTSGMGNTAYGYIALSGNVNGSHNTATGNQAAQFNIGGNYNTANGDWALAFNTGGSENTAIGTSAIEKTTGNQNTAIGSGAGYNATGSGNVFVGNRAGFQETGSNKLYIANSSPTTLIYGDFSAGFVGINTITPTASLEVHGASGAVLKIVDGNQAAGKVLTSDATGQGSWQTPSGGGTSNWTLLGNTGTVDGTNFIGTTDNVAFNIRVGNQKAGRIDLDPNFANTFLGYLSGNSNTGGGNTASGYQSLTHNTTGNYNTAIGLDALGANVSGNGNSATGLNSIENNISGNNNTAQGYQAIFSNVAGSGATAIGYNAMQYANNTATPFDNFNVALGFEALRGSNSPANNTGNANSAFGYQSLWSNTSGSYNTASGTNALYANTTGGGNAAFGVSALHANTSGSDNTATGTNALPGNTTGIQNTATGSGALYSNTSGNNNTANGMQALVSNTTGMQNTATGADALYSNVAGSNATAIGYNAMFYANNSTTTFINKNIALGFEALRGSAVAADNTGNGNIALGYQSLWNNTNGSYNTASGMNALYANTSGNNNTANGVQALTANTSGSDNTAIGTSALLANTTGVQNTANGLQALQANTTGNANTANGISALHSNTTGANNTALGQFSGFNNSTGSGNVFLGSMAGFSETGSNKLYIANTNNNPPLIYGDFIAGMVGINTIAPQAMLEVDGASGTTIRIVDGNQAAGKVLTSDATGQGSWQTPSGGGSGWALTGNAGTVDANNFIGTTDNIPFNIRVNNQKAGRIDGTLANTFFGYQAGKANTNGSANTANGYGALSSNSTGAQNTAYGAFALQFSTTGIGNTATGYNALDSITTGGFNAAIGNYALKRNTVGNGNAAFGNQALQASRTGSNNTAIGNSAGFNNYNGSSNVFLGNNAGYNETGSNKLYIANSSTNPPLIFGDFSTGNVGINTITTAAKLEVHGTSGTTIKIVDGNQAVGKVLTSDATGQGSWQTLGGGGSGWSLTGNAGTVDGTNFIGTTDDIPFNIRVNNQKAGRIERTLANTFFGYQSGNANTTGVSNTATGENALLANTTGSYNTAVGVSALYANITGGNNTATGLSALYANTSGSGNTAEGVVSLTNNTTGYENTATGLGALYGNTTGNENTANGVQSLYSNTTGINNTSLGHSAGYSSTTGNANVFIGYSAGYNETGSNKLYIANSSANPPLIYGDFSIGNVGIGTITPIAKLEVHGTSGTTIKIVDGNQAAGKVLTSDATGQGSWQTLSGAGVISVSSGNLSPLFTTSVTNATTTPALAFTISNVGAYTLFGNNTNAAAAPTFFTPTLASALFQNQGSTTAILHGNASGNPSWGSIVNADITNGTIDITTKVTGILPIANGGTNISTIGTAGSVIYSNGTQHGSTAIGTSGQVLTSSGAGAPIWTTPSGGGGGWAITGNIGTTASTAAIGSTANNNYIGSIDAKDFVIASNNLERMRITSSGNIGIGTISPNSTASLHVELGSSTTNGILITGAYNYLSTIPSLGVGSRMMFYPGKVAFRAGYVSSTQWDNANVGFYSIAMGNSTTASGEASIAVGSSTTASGFVSTAFGFLTTANGSQSTSMGSYVSTNALTGAFIIGDYSTYTPTNSSAANEMTMRFAGGYRLFSNAGLTAGVTLASGGGAWASVSDKRKKENFRTLDPEEVLLKIKNMPVTEWNYKAQDNTNHHIGPMAQDFYAAFKLSGIGNDTTITTTDIDGVNMIAIQALEKRTTQLKQAQNELTLKTNELEKLKTEVDNVKKENSEFKNKFIQLENEIDAIQLRNLSAKKTE